MKFSFRYIYLLGFILFVSFSFGQETYLDQFSSVSYSNNDGTQNWAGDWVESGDTNSGPTSQYIYINNNQLQLYYLWSENIRRTANLSGATSATLSFDWQTISLTSTKGLSIQVSSNGGASYTNIGTINGTTSGSFSYDISAFIASNTTIRFLKSNQNWNNNDYARIDNVQIEATLSSNTPPVLAATGNQIFCPGASIPIAETISITDADDTTTTAVYIQISSGYVNGEDLLTLTGTHPNITPSWDAVQGELSLTGTALYTEYEAAILAVEYSSSGAPIGTRQFSITVGEANFLPFTAHYYEYVADLGITWTDARDAAAAKTHFGLQGYLATLTSQEEADFSGSQAPGVGWIGGSDAASEGDWRWVTGPEAGTSFWSGAVGGSVTAPYNFAFWNTNEPNQSGNEDYAHITHPNVNPNGSWNDLSNAGSSSGNYQPQGYVVEYGGTSGDPILSITATTTIIVDNVAPTASNPSAVAVYCIADIPTANINVVTDEADNCTASPIVTYIGEVTNGGSNPEIITRTYRITDDGSNSIDVTQTITINSVAITSQPSNQNVIAGNNGIFSVTAINANTYQWQVSINGGVSFSDIADGTNYSGTQTATMTVISADLDKNDYVFRANISNSGSVLCTPITSNEVVLTISVGTVITNRGITYRVNKN